MIKTVERWSKMQVGKAVCLYSKKHGIEHEQWIVSKYQLRFTAICFFIVLTLCNIIITAKCSCSPSGADPGFGRWGVAVRGVQQVLLKAGMSECRNARN